VNLPALISIDSEEKDSIYANLPNLIEAFSQEVPWETLNSLGLFKERIGGQGSILHDLEMTVTKPLIIPPVTPDHRLPAEQRLRIILSGGVSRKQGEVITGEKEQLVEKVIDFLREEAVVTL